MDNLRKFLVKAKVATYASDGESESLLDGSKKFTFTEGDFKYEDWYFGTIQFSGDEVVFHKSVIVWRMNYHGGLVSENASARGVYGFLKKAMRRVSENRPFRGPAKFSEGDFKYVDESTGDLDKFKGCEKKFYKDELVYDLEYHGGFVKK